MKIVTKIDLMPTTDVGKRLQDVPPGVYYSKSANGISVKIDDTTAFSISEYGLKFDYPSKFWPTDYVPHDKEVTITFSND